MSKEYLAKLIKRFGVKDISFDSRNVKSGDIYFAIKGDKYDGNDYIKSAIENGALVVITEQDEFVDNKLIFKSNNIRKDLAITAGIVYPALPKHLIAVTGTNGKTSVCSFAAQIAKLLGYEAATIGTTGIDIFANNKDINFNDITSELTTPDPVKFRKILNSLANQNIEFIAFEASSHGLSQERLGDLQVDGAIFTSFSQDHLDYHKTMESYLEAKLKLFTSYLKPNSKAFINSEISEKEEIISKFQADRVNYIQVGKDGDIAVRNIIKSREKQDVTYNISKESFTFSTGLIGSFQANNLLLAASICSDILNEDWNKINKILPQVISVKGRMERLAIGSKPYEIFIDFAHTPDALEKTLIELKAINPEGRLLVLFGCGGDRDKSKRPIMGEIACKNADIVIITDDNPRTEDPKKIHEDIISGCDNTSKIINIQGRANAIAEAITLLKKDDILIISGKGHEEYQIIGSTRSYFSDHSEVMKNII